MSKITKIWLVIATSLMLIGCIIFVGVMSILKWDFTKLSTGKYEINNYEITETVKAMGENLIALTEIANFDKWKEGVTDDE